MPSNTSNPNSQGAWFNAPGLTPLWVPYSATTMNLGNVSNTPDIRMVLFYGFTGILALHYTILEKMDKEELEARMMAFKIPWMIIVYENFKHILAIMAGTPNALKEISFENAIEALKKDMENTEIKEFDEPEEDEFGKDCTIECRPGRHRHKQRSKGLL